MTGDRPYLGIALMLGFCVLAPLADGTAKIMAARMPVAEIVLVRFATQVVLLLPLVLATGRSLAISRPMAGILFIRALLHIAGIGMMFLALKYMPLADAVAIAFVMPFIMLILGKYFLHEEVGPRRLWACVVGFAGTLMVIQPSFVALGPVALLPLGVAVIFAFFMLLTRKIAKDIDPVTLQAVNGMMATAFLIPAFLLLAPFDVPALQLIMPSGVDWTLLAVLGVIGTVAHLLMTWSLRFAPSTTLAPIQYLEIPIATFVGWLFFREFPNGLALLGIMVVIASGLYVLLRERAIAMRVPAPE